MEGLQVWLSKLSNYHILANIIPGCALCFIFHYMGIPIFYESLLVNIAICYLVGLVNGRVASLIIEPILKSLKIVKFADYKRYTEARKENSFIKTLNDDNNLYRAFISVFLIAIFAFVMVGKREEYCCHTLILLVALLLLFVCAYRKQTMFIVEQVNETLGIKGEASSSQEMDSKKQTKQKE